MHATDDHKPIPTDDVFSTKIFRQKVYSLSEAINDFRCIYHPTLYDEPKSQLFAKIELNMQGEKKVHV